MEAPGKNRPARDPGSPVWIVDEDSDHVDTRFTLSELLAHKERNKDCIDGRTLLLPPDVGRLENGMLAGGSSDEVRDVADFHDADEPQTRLRLWDVPAGEDARTDKMQLVREIRVRDDIDAESGGDGAEDDGGEPASLPSRQVWRWYGLPSRADAENSRYARRDVLLKDHNAQVERYARTFAEKLGLPPGLKEAVRLAGQFHDAGKARSVWQKSIGNHDPDKILAKSNGRAAARAVPTGYRHEWGSLLDLLDTVELKNLSEEMQDVTLHLIAAHHGGARPHFSLMEFHDLQHTPAPMLMPSPPRRRAALPGSVCKSAAGGWPFTSPFCVQLTMPPARTPSGPGVSGMTRHRRPVFASMSIRPIRANSSPVVGCSNLPTACSGGQGWFDSGDFGLTSASTVGDLRGHHWGGPLDLDPADQTASPISVAPPFDLRLDWWQSNDRG